MSTVSPYSGRVIHARTHPSLDVEGCGPCRWSTVRIGISEGVKQTVDAEKQLSADMDAYKRLRREGLQPGHLKGSADSEKTATRRADIEHPELKAVPTEYLQAAGMS